MLYVMEQHVVYPLVKGGAILNLSSMNTIATLSLVLLFLLFLLLGQTNYFAQMLGNSMGMVFR